MAMGPSEKGQQRPSDSQPTPGRLAPFAPQGLEAPCTAFAGWSYGRTPSAPALRKRWLSPGCAT
eukprot:3162626-Lingulodinium_polyedra.AAC.1